MRLFIAIPLPANVRKELKYMQAAVIEAAPGALAVPEENFHITLRYLGETRELAGASAALAQCVRAIRPFSLHLSRCGSFRQGSGHTVYMGLGGDLTELNALFESLDAALFEQGFSREHRRFLPHITLARGASLTDAELLSLGERRPNASFLVNAVELYESTRRAGTVRYSRLQRAEL